MGRVVPNSRRAMGSFVERSIGALSVTARSIRVVVVEDEALIAEELRVRLTRLGMTVVATADTAAQACLAAVECTPDVILMDVRLKDGDDGIEAARRIRERVDVPIIYVTAHSDRSTLDRAKPTLPYGFVLKPFHEADLRVAIEMAVDRHARERSPAEQSPSADAARQRYLTLTPRERAVFLLLVAGRLNKQIAVELGVAERTVKAHRAKVLQKMDAGSIAGLTRSATLLGM